MESEPGTDQATPSRAADGDSTPGFWARVREHKIIQWGVGYFGAALALAQGEQLLGQAFGWPDAVTRLLMIVLVIGLPIALTVAWYHGHRGLKQISAGELAIISALLLIGALFFVAVSPSSGERVEASSRDTASDTRAGEATETGSEPAPPASATERAVIPGSVAVLPLDNLSADADSATYALGMHAEIIGQLSKLRNVTVIGRDSVMEYAGNRPLPERIATELGVESLMAGTFQLIGDQIRISVQLVDPATGANLWSADYQSDFADAFTVQADIAMNVANALAVEFSAAEQADIERRQTTSDEAYRLFLQAAGVIAAGAGGAYDTANSLLDRALALDAGFAHAHGFKAMMYALRFTNNAQGAGVPTDEQADLARQVRTYADTALALDPRESLAKGALQMANVLTWRWSAVDLALEPDPYSGTGAYEAWIHAWMGRAADGVRIADEIFERNPNVGIRWIILAVSQAYAGDRVGSIETLQRALQVFPTNGVQRAWLSYNHIALGNESDALAELESVEKQLGADRPIVYLPELAYAYTRLGRTADAQRIFDEFRGLAETADPGAGGWAVAYWAIGDKAQTLRWLDVLAEKARNHEADLGMVNAMNLKMNFLADPALETPEMRAALDRLRGD